MRIAIIPARGGSKRIPEKNIMDFCGNPMISYSLQAAKQSQLFDEIHVSTDSEKIKQVVEGLGFPVEFLRSKELADDHTAIFPVIKWVIEQYKERGKEIKEICILFPTAPLIESSDLKKAYDLFEEKNGNHVTMSCSKFEVPIQWALKQNKEGLLQPREPDTLTTRSQDLEEYFFDSGLFYFLKPEHLDKPIGVDYLPYVIDKNKSVDIDEMSDLNFAKSLYLMKKEGK